MCGVPISPDRREGIAEYEDAVRRPPMEEPEWRRQGFLAVPTRYQMSHQTSGCCSDCAKKIIYRNWRPGARGIAWAAGFVAVMWLLSYVYIFARE